MLVIDKKKVQRTQVPPKMFIEFEHNNIQTRGIYIENDVTPTIISVIISRYVTRSIY